MLTSERFTSLILEGRYLKWVDRIPYDTRPYVESGRFLPVPFELCNASDESIDLPLGDVLYSLTSLPIGSIVVIPSYHGTEHSIFDDKRFIRNQVGWARI